MPFLQHSGQGISFVLREFRHMRGRILGDRELAGQADQRVDAPGVDPAESGPSLPVLTEALADSVTGSGFGGEQLRDGISQGSGELSARLFSVACATIAAASA